MTGGLVRSATPADAGELANLLHRFNQEFGADTPGPAALESRLARLLGEPTTFAIVHGDPIDGLALVTLRTNVWYEGPVALLDELYVVPDRRGGGIGSALIGCLVVRAERLGVGAIEIGVDEGDTDARRFYRRHGFDDVEPDTGERAHWFRLELEVGPGLR